MEAYAGPGWSRPSFMRRLAVLKARGWVRVVGSDDKSISPTAKVDQGSLYEATVFEDLRPVLPVSKQSPLSMNESRSELARVKKAAQEQLQRKGGKSSAA
jgi:hypothetical protein